MIMIAQFAPTFAPLGTVIAAGITAGLGGWLGGRLSRKNQERQHRFEQEQALTLQGQEKAREAISALRHLQRNRRAVAEWSSALPEGELGDDHHHYDQLGQAIEFLNDKVVREQVELVYDAIAGAWTITRFGDHNISDASDVIIWRACHEGRTVLGRYLRAEPTQEPSDYLKSLRRAYDSAHEELERQREDWLKSQEATEGEKASS